VVAINKMDLMDFSEQVFEKIKADYIKFSEKLRDAEFHFIPMSALNGDNVVNPSENMPWFEGKPLMQLLDTIDIDPQIDHEHFRLPVQYVNRPHLDFRGFCGTIAAGEIEQGDKVTVLPSGKVSTVKKVILPTIDSSLHTKKAYAPMAVTITLEDEIDVSRGDMLVKSDDVPQVADHFSVKLVWMADTPMRPGHDYLIKRATNVVSGRFTQIEYQVDVNTLETQPTETLALNGIAQVKLQLTQSLAYDAYDFIKGTGSFIVIDKYTHATLGAGMIEQGLSESQGDKGVQREYSAFEKDLNALIRQHFPEWGCRPIEDLL
jgi:sulfate adenylyltransferase subunit 1